MEPNNYRGAQKGETVCQNCIFSFWNKIPSRPRLRCKLLRNAVVNERGTCDEARAPRSIAYDIADEKDKQAEYNSKPTAKTEPVKRHMDMPERLSMPDFRRKTV